MDVRVQLKFFGALGLIASLLYALAYFLGGIAHFWQMMILNVR